MTTKTDIQSAAELERRRLATQAAQARASAKSQAQQARAETETQAQQVVAETESQARAAKAQAEKEAKARQAEIRKSRGQVEKEAQVAMAKARKARSIEQRKVVLPFTKPQGLGVQTYIAEVESVRKKAHQTGKDEKAAVSRVRDEYIKQVDKWEAESLANISKQLEGIQAEISMSLIEARAEIAKQQADLYSGITVWETRALKGLADLETKNVKLDTGEWVSKGAFNNLPPDSQGLLKTVGVDEFNKRIEAGVKDFKASHTEIKPDVWVSKREWDGLTSAQQKEFIDTGQYTPSPQIMFEGMKEQGLISADAKYKGFNEETQQIEYIVEKHKYTAEEFDDIEKEFLKLPELQQRSMIASQVKYLEPWKVKEDMKEQLEALTKEQRERVLRYYHAVVKPVKTTEDLKEVLKHDIKVYGDFYIGMIPIVGTVYHWDKMSPTWRGISIALDVVCVLPFIAAGVKAIKASVHPLKAQVSALVKAETTVGRQMAQTLSKAYAVPSKVKGVSIPNRELGKAYTTMINAQGNYLKKLTDIAELTAKGKTISTKAKMALVGAEIKLREAAQTFTNTLYRANSQIKGVRDIPVRFDSAEVRALMNSLPNEMVQNTKMAVRALQVKPSNVKVLTRAVNSAETALKAARAKYPTDPSKWVDLMYELMRAEGKLAQARTGSVTTLHQKLMAARNAGRTAEAAKLERKLAEAIKGMEVEWGRLGFFSGGKVAIATRTKPFLPTTGAPPAISAATKTGAATKAGITAIVIKAGLENWDESKGVTTPEVVEAAKEIAKTLPKVEGVSTPEVVAITMAALQESLKAAMEGMTDHEIEVRALNATKSITKTYVDQKIMSQTEAKAMAATAAKVATKVATKVVTVAMTKHKKLIAKGRDDEGEEKKRKKYPDGTIAWRMGETKDDVYKIIPPPYTLQKPITSKYPPRGMRRTKGTPQQTLTFIGDKVPFNNVSFDLGITDGFIDVKSKRIKFTGGGQKTNVGTRIESTTKGVALVHNPPQISHRENQRRPLLSHGVYSDKAGSRITRRHHRGWRRIY